MPAHDRRGSAGSFAAAVTAGGIIAQQVAGKAVRDALFLSSFHATSLPRVMAAAAALSLIAVLWISRLVSRHAPRRVIPWMFALGATALTAEWGLVFVSPRVAAVAVYLHIAVFAPALLSTFWSLVNEQFDPHTAKAAVARIATGGTVGGVLGGLGAWRASTLVSVPTTVVILAGLNFLCLVGVLLIPKPIETSRVPSSEAPFSKEALPALRVLRGAPYLRNLAVLVSLGAATSSLLDYVFSAQAVAAYGKGPSLLAFFSLFGVSVSLLSLLLQVSLGRLAMEKLGLAMNIAVLPGVIILGGAAGIAVPGLASATLMRGAEMVQRNTLFRSAYELLYTPLEEQQKRSTKAVIDIGFDRFGTMIGSLIVIATVAMFAHHQNVLLGVVVALAATTLPLARRLHLGYVEALERGLREGERRLAIAPHVGRLSTVEVDERARDRLIQRVEQLRDHDDGAGPAAAALAQPRELTNGVLALLSNHVEKARRALGEWNKEKTPLVAFGILLLAHKELHRDARSSLRAVADRVTGQLVDALLDPEMDFVVRRRLPLIIGSCTTQRAADGLLLGLADARFEVRYACGRALMKVADRGRDIVFSREMVIETVMREIERATNEFSVDESDDDPNPMLDAISRDRVSRSVENLFVLLSLILEREPLRLCFRALHQENDRHRGTALEYLQTVLPSGLREALLSLLSEAGPIPTPRSPADILAELTGAMSSPTARAEDTEGRENQGGPIGNTG